MIKAVIFDFGGVIGSSRNLCVPKMADLYEISEEMLIKNMLPPLEPFRKGLITEDEFWKQLSLSLGKPIPKDSKDLWKKCYEQFLHIDIKMTGFIEELRDKGIKTAVLSNVIKPHAEIISRRGFYKIFDVSVLSYKEHLQKPEKEIYLLTAKRLEVEPGECIFIDDREENLEPANELKMRAVLAENTEQIIDEVRRLVNL